MPIWKDCQHIYCLKLTIQHSKFYHPYQLRKFAKQKISMKKILVNFLLRWSDAKYLQILKRNYLERIHR